MITRCVVPFCRRTTRRKKRLLSLVKRRRRWELYDRIWERSKAQAIEAVPGIA